MFTFRSLVILSQKYWVLYSCVFSFLKVAYSTCFAHWFSTNNMLNKPSLAKNALKLVKCWIIWCYSFNEFYINEIRRIFRPPQLHLTDYEWNSYYIHLWWLPCWSQDNANASLSYDVALARNYVSRLHDYMADYNIFSDVANSDSRMS